MAVYSTNTKAGPFTADGEQTVFPFGFRCIDASDILVYKNDKVVPATEYEVGLRDDMSDGHYDSGNVIFGVAPEKDDVIVILRNVPITQETDLQNNTAFYPEVLESAYDKLTMVCQQLAEKIGRAILQPVSSTPGTPGTPGTPDNPDDPDTPITDDPYQIIMEGLATVNLAIETCTSLVRQAAWWANEAAAAGGAAEFYLSYDVYGETQFKYPTIVEPGPDDPGVPDYPQLPHGSQIFWETSVGKAYYGEDDGVIQSVRIIPGENFPGDAIVFFTI